MSASNKIAYLDRFRTPQGQGSAAAFTLSPSGAGALLPSSAMSSAIPLWNDSVIRRLEALSSMQLGWDGFSAAPVRPDVAYFTSQFLSGVLDSASTPPTILPLHSGGLQIDWHLETVDIEVTITAPFEVSAWWRDKTNAIEEEFDMTTNFSQFERAAKFVRNSDPAHLAA